MKVTPRLPIRRPAHALPRLRDLSFRSGPLLGRVRWMFLVFALSNDLVACPIIAFSHATPAARGCAAFGLLWLAGWSVRCSKRGHFPWAGDVVTGLSLVAVAWGAGSVGETLGVFYVNTFLRALYGSPPRVGFATAMEAAAYAVSLQVTTGINGELVFQVPGLVFTAAILCFTRIVLDRHEEALRHEHILRETGTVLVAATTLDGILDAAISAAVVLADNFEHDARTHLAIGADERLTTVRRGTHEGKACESRQFDLTDLPPVMQEALAQRRPRVIAGIDSHAFSGCFGMEPLAFTTVIAVANDVQLLGALVLSTQRRPPQDLVAAIAVACGQVALALQRNTAKAWFDLAVRNTSDLFMILERDTTMRYVSPAVRPILGYEPEWLIGRRFDELVHRDDRQRFHDCCGAHGAADKRVTAEYRVVHQDGGERVLDSTFSDLTDDPLVGGVLLNTRDVSERKGLENRLREQALHDPLTGLPNRRLFMDRLEVLLAQRDSAAARSSTLIFIDLDRFKLINDSLGHAAGDEVLAETARRLLAVARRGDTVARFGGDEFVVLCPELDREQDARGASDRFARALAQPMEVAGRSIAVSASLGLALTSGAHTSADALVRDADAAMYRAKQRGRARTEIFVQGPQEDRSERMELVQDLPRAIAAREIVLHYQPAIDLHDGRVRAVEALARWQHPKLGLLAPDRFIPLAEESGLIVPLGRLILRDACLQAHAWHRQAPTAPLLRMCVNISPSHLCHETFVTEVSEIAAATGIDSETLILEVTESALVADEARCMTALADLRRLGIRVSIDDYGTGYASLSYVKRFSMATALKLDRSFIRGIPDDSTDLAIVSAIIAMARSLGIRSVAEGVETAEQLRSLLALQCDVGQGYLFARPLPADDFTQFICSGSWPYWPVHPSRLAAGAPGDGPAREPNHVFAARSGT